VVPGGFVGVGSPSSGTKIIGVLFVVAPPFSTCLHRCEPDEGSIQRNLCLQEACHDIGSIESKSTDHSRRSSTTLVTVGLRAGSCCQQLVAMFHTGSVRPSSRASRGRAGRPPPTIFKTMDGVLKLLNGYFPVKA